MLRSGCGVLRLKLLRCVTHYSKLKRRKPRKAHKTHRVLHPKGKKGRADLTAEDRAAAAAVKRRRVSAHAVPLQLDLFAGLLTERLLVFSAATPTHTTDKKKNKQKGGGAAGKQQQQQERERNSPDKHAEKEKKEGGKDGRKGGGRADSRHHTDNKNTNKNTSSIYPMSSMSSVYTGLRAHLPTVLKTCEAKYSLYRYATFGVALVSICFAVVLSLSGVLQGSVSLGSSRLSGGDNYTSGDGPDVCASQPCRHKGVCTASDDGRSSYRCACAEGFHGSTCENKSWDRRVMSEGAEDSDWWDEAAASVSSIDDTTVCEEGPCLNGGECVLPLDFETAGGRERGRCKCLNGYEGVSCEVDVNECESRPCKNGGTCVDIPSGYTCVCNDQWDGIHCDIRQPTSASRGKPLGVKTTKTTTSGNGAGGGVEGWRKHHAQQYQDQQQRFTAWDPFVMHGQQPKRQEAETKPPPPVQVFLDNEDDAVPHEAADELKEGQQMFNLQDYEGKSAKNRNTHASRVFAPATGSPPTLSACSSCDCLPPCLCPCPCPSPSLRPVVPYCTAC